SPFPHHIITTPPPPHLSPFYVTHPAPPEISPLSLHDALPICDDAQRRRNPLPRRAGTELQPREVRRCEQGPRLHRVPRPQPHLRSEEHTSELQSLTNLVCRLMLEKKKK